MSGGWFVSDYRPTKRIGVEELGGAITALANKLDEIDESGEATADFYIGALLTLETIRYGNFEYPRDFLAVFENKVNAYIAERG